nr:efflux RND transporter permease subunit [Pseudomonas bharatica]
MLKHRNLAFASAVGVVVLTGAMASRMGSEFIPSLSEGDLALQALRVPGTSLSQSVEMQQRLEKALLQQVPEVQRVFARTGTAEIAADPMPPNISTPTSCSSPRRNGRIRQIAGRHHRPVQQAAASVPGSSHELSQPIQLRFNELISGVRSDVAVKVFGDDMDTLNRTAAKIATALQGVPGASEVKVEQTTGLPC